MHFFTFLFICRRYLKTKRMKTVSSGIAVTVLLFVDTLCWCRRRSSSEKVLRRHLESHQGLWLLLPFQGAVPPYRVAL